MSLADALSLASILSIVWGAIFYGRWETRSNRWRDHEAEMNRRAREAMNAATDEALELKFNIEQQIKTLSENDAAVAKALNDLGARVADCEATSQMQRGFK